MKKNINILIFLIAGFLQLNAQTERTLVLTDEDQVKPKVMEATESITLLPGFYYGGPKSLTLRIFSGEDDFQAVKGVTYNLNEHLNWITSSSYDLCGQLTSSGVSYFNSLGKATQTHSLDIKTGKIWVTETRYDAFGKPVFNTLSAPIGYDYGYKSDFIKKTDNTTLSAADIENITNNNSTIAIKPESGTLGWYYSNQNTSEKYQDVTAYPFSKTIYSQLRPGIVQKVLGGNKISKTTTSSPEWLQTYSFDMPMAQELFYAFGTNNFPLRPLENSVRPYYLKGKKTVIRDTHGVESVVFNDSNGNVLAAARSGNEDNPDRAKYKVLSAIGPQGYVDIHIPVGCQGQVQLLGPSTARFTVYDLVTDVTYNNYENINRGSYVFASGMYRIQETTNKHKISKPYTTIREQRPSLLNGSVDIGVLYDVNYYDYSLNYYDKANRLTSSVQPLGFKPLTNNQTIENTRQHTLISTFTYNGLGQLIETTRPDEGTANFKYRKDGQIRYSQNSKQVLVNEFSFTDYDNLGRPIRSGITTGNFTDLNPDANRTNRANDREVQSTLYDISDGDLQEILAGTVVNPSAYNQQFVAGNVSRTNNSNTTTYYSYDVYGRVTWMVQEINGLPPKTIHYEYDFSTGQVSKVLYQMDGNTPKEDSFVHKYTYNVAGELYKVETSTDNSNFTEQAKYKYYETGALKRTEIAENVQGIDYIYNLNGQLKAINHPSKSPNLDPGNDGNNGIAADIFGFAIDYYNGDYTRTNTPKPVTTTAQGTNQFNGNIKGVRWSNAQLNINNQSGQLFTYNKNNWLKEALFGITNNNATITTGEDYKVSGITYDANGNIQTLNRNKNTENGSNRRMDELTYFYKSNKPNQLDYVKDDVGDKGVGDMVYQGPGNYYYNSIGQLVENIDEGVYYHYNASGLVTKVFSGDELKVEFKYNDKNYRTEKITYGANGVDVVKRTHYVLDAAGSPMAIYENGVQVEVPIYGASRLGIYKRTSNSSLYQLADHLGNVRAVIFKDTQGNLITSSATDYYPGGMPMPNRRIGSDGYRFGYQGEFAETDEETGKPAFEARLYDPRINRWLTTDPNHQFASPYVGMGNFFTNGIDPDGRDVILLYQGTAPFGTGLSGHTALLIGNDIDGWRFYNKAGGNDENGVAISNTLPFNNVKEFSESLGSSYRKGIHITTSADVDARMKQRAADIIGVPYDFENENCQDFCRNVIETGGIDLGEEKTRFGITFPREEFFNAFNKTNGDMIFFQDMLKDSERAFKRIRTRLMLQNAAHINGGLGELLNRHRFVGSHSKTTTIIGGKGQFEFPNN